MSIFNRYRIPFILIVIIPGSFMITGSFLAAPDRKEEAVINDTVNSADFPFAGQNAKCLRCHGNDHYVISDTVSDITIKKIMYPEYRISEKDFYLSNHKTFSCIDCHSASFSVFPHSLEDRMEEKYNCLDCHGNDENYAKYHFEEIQEEYDKSTHASIQGFSCWKCHDPHSYHITARTSSNLLLTVQYDNRICLGCHSDFRKLSVYSERQFEDISKKHEWLPNQSAHFSSVRCIECHTRINDTILIPHELLPALSAVRRCTECHSRDSRLMETLYKFQKKEKRKSGFLNPAILDESYVIAANRNIRLNMAGFIIFGMVMVAILIHVTLRIIKTKRE